MFQKNLKTEIFLDIPGILKSKEIGRLSNNTTVHIRMGHGSEKECQVFVTFISKDFTRENGQELAA